MKDNFLSYVPARLDYSRNSKVEDLIAVHFDVINYNTESIEIIRQNQEKIKEKIGNELYNTLVEKVTEEEEKLKKVLNEKGIDW